jgi:hypothetical protein
MNVFLDCDGVLGNFDAHCVALFGKTPTELGDVELWRLVQEDSAKFWLEMPVMAGAYELMEVAKPHNVTVLTGCPYDVNDRDRICGHAERHKAEWIAAKFGDVPVITCFSKHKPLHMKAPRDILVDDFIANVKKWQKAGGRTVWYRDAEQAIADLKRKLETTIV